METIQKPAEQQAVDPALTGLAVEAQIGGAEVAGAQVAGGEAAIGQTPGPEAVVSDAAEMARRTEVASRVGAIVLGHTHAVKLGRSRISFGASVERTPK